MIIDSKKIYLVPTNSKQSNAFKTKILKHSEILSLIFWTTFEKDFYWGNVFCLYGDFLSLLVKNNSGILNNTYLNNLDIFNKALK